MSIPTPTTTPTPERTLSLPQLAKLAAAEQVRMARAGELRWSQVWVAMKGAGKYLKAIASGDIRGQLEAHLFAGVCSNCPWARKYSSAIDGVDLFFCGPRFEERGHTCGCMVGVMQAGNEKLMPAGAAWVASHACPMGMGTSTRPRDHST